MNCSNCDSPNIETDHSKGSSICLNCGFVTDEGNIVADVSFDNTKVVGTFVSNFQNGPLFLKNKHYNYFYDSRQSRINNANQEIINIADKLCK